MSSSDSDDEPVIRYGTPLEPYEEDAVPLKRKFQQKGSEQHAVDAHGRRRFHGAFTGGFTAGHGNSVSTPEGWTPATFKSTRTERGNFKTHAPEDFMDEEDRGEFGIAPRLIQVQSDFAGQKRPHSGKRFHDGPIPGEPVLEQFVRAVPDTAALRLLRAMGWRPGQGVGEQRTRAPNKVYGCYVPPEFRQTTEGDAEESDGSDIDYDTLFAPEDYEPYLLPRKDDLFGLGYSGLSRHSVLGGLSAEYGAGGSSISHLKMKDKGKKVSIRGQAFGVGALEEEDEDVYAGEDMSHYDFAIGGPKPAAAPAKDKRKSEGLEGFVRAKRPQPPARGPPPPALPRGYTPAPAGFAPAGFVRTGLRSDPAATDAPHYTKLGLGRHELTPEARGALLGEPSHVSSHRMVPLPNTSVPPPGFSIPPPGSSFPPPDYSVPPPTTRPLDPLASLGRSVAFVGPGGAGGEKKDSIGETGEETVETGTENVFKPFASDPEKQARYERFVRGETAAAGGGGRLAEWEAARELSEFQQAAKLYRPLTGVLRDRFTAGQRTDDAVDPLVGVARSRRGGSGVAEQAREAAARGMHGALTRSVAEWRPHGLVCKRFNIPDPFGARPDMKTIDKPKSTYSIFEYLEGSIHNKESFAKEQTHFSGSKSITQQILPSNVTAAKSITLPPVMNVSNLENINEGVEKSHGNKRMTVADLFLIEAEKERLSSMETRELGEEVTKAIDKFDKMELYKSIFLSDSEEENNDIDNNNKQGKEDADFTETPANIERNDSPPRGIFANLDFDQLNSWSSKSKPVEDSQALEPKRNKLSRWHNVESINEISNPKKVEKDNNLKISKEISHNNKSNRDGIEDEVVELFVSESGGVAKRAKTPEHTKKVVDIDELFLSPKINDTDIYGPKIPENLKKKIEIRATELESKKMLGNATVSNSAFKELDIEEVFSGKTANVEDLPRPMFRDKNARRQEEEPVLEVNSSSDSDAWVDVNVTKKVKKKKKKNKKHKHKSKNKKKDR